MFCALLIGVMKSTPDMYLDLVEHIFITIKAYFVRVPNHFLALHELRNTLYNTDFTYTSVTFQNELFSIDVILFYLT